ncbi:hypothetical protein JCM8202v2_001506 [Rhodotorula sphaerocarpa]
MQRHYRPRPVNLAGPSYRQDSALQMSPDYRASFQSGHSTDADGSAMASGDESVSGSIGRGSLLAGKSAAKKPLWAIGGVFPKHERHRRSTTGTQASGRPRNDSSAGRETDSSGRRESAPQQSRRDSRRSSRGARKDSHTRQGSRQQDRRPAVDTITGGVTPGSQVIESDIETQGDWGVSERPDPFEDQQTVPASGTKPLDVVVSNDSGRSREPERSDSPPGRTAAPESRDRPGLEDDRASEGSSPTIFDEAQPDEKRGKHEHTEDEAESIEHERDADVGHDTENTGQALGGKLDQRSDEWQDDTGEDLPIRNRWGMVRYALREPFAEFLGTLVLVVIGVGSTCQTKLSQSQYGAFQSQNWAWGFGVMTALYIAGGISGGHANPAVTIVLAIFRGFPWKMVPRYVIAQVFGAFCGALLLYGNYKRAIEEYDPTKGYATYGSGGNVSATLFVTAPAENIGNPVQGFCQEILASGILSIAVLALGDENNAPPGAGIGAIVLGFVVVSIGMSNGWVSGYAINPARDLGPRIALSCLGYSSGLWTDYWWWWLLGPICGPVVGGIAGALAYDLLIFTGPGSPVNYSSRELWLSSGLPSLHNMVWIAMSPNKKRSREHNSEHVAEAGNITAQAAMRTDMDRPGKAKPEQLNEAALIRRYRRGQRKVNEQDKSDQRRKQERQENIRRSLEAEQDTVRGQQESPDFRVVDEETEDEHAMRGGTVGAD